MPEVTQLSRGKCGVHTLLHLTLTQTLVPQNQKQHFFEGEFGLLSGSDLHAFGRELRLMAALTATGAFAYPNKAYSTRAGTSWHVVWNANRSDSARQNSLDWQLFPCPAVQQMGDEQQSGLAGTNISAFLRLFVCQGSETGE